MPQIKSESTSPKVSRGIRPKAGPGTMALVQCPTFRCLATFGEDGIWRDMHLQPVKVLEIEEVI